MIRFLKALLGKMPVLTMFTSEVATGTGDAEPEMTGNEMIDGSFLNWADINDRRITIDKTIQCSSPVLSIPAKSSFPFRDDTFPRTENTLNIPAIRFFIVEGFFERGN